MGEDHSDAANPPLRAAARFRRTDPGVTGLEVTLPTRDVPVQRTRVDLPSVKPGIVFATVDAGGILMDIAANRYFALNRFSAGVWSALVEGRTREQIASAIATGAGLDDARAGALLDRQIDAWRRAGLIGVSSASVALPFLKHTNSQTPSEFTIKDARLSVVTLLRCLWHQLYFKRSLRTCGLRSTLLRLQGIAIPGRANHYETVTATLKAYNALRSIYMQGRTAVDCLPRSIGLAACLRAQGIDADVCIGITQTPFAAHAWVEACGCILNETLARCSTYTVIARF